MSGFVDHARTRILGIVNVEYECRQPSQDLIGVNGDITKQGVGQEKRKEINISVRDVVSMCRLRIEPYALREGA